MARDIKKGSTDQSTTIRILDATTFLPEEAVEHDTSGLALWYRRQGGTKTTITPAALAALDSAHSDGGIEHIDDGYYRLDLPDNAVLTGANDVTIGGTCTDMIIIGSQHSLVDFDPQDAVRMGLTALPNAAANAAGGLVTSTAGSLDLDTMAANIVTAILPINKKRALVKESSVWYNVIYDDDGTTELKKKAMKDKDGNNISDLSAGQFAIELANSI